MALRAEKWHLMAPGGAQVALRAEKWHLMAPGGALMALRAEKWHLMAPGWHPDGIKGQEMDVWWQLEVP